MNRARGGFSLLEVILALAILAGAIAVLGEMTRLGIRNASYSRDMTQAQLLCESKMAQITSGMILPEAEVGVPFAPEDLIDPDDPVTWFYAIELAAVEEPGVVAVGVTVAQDLPSGQHPVRFSLVRWIVDPGVELSEQPAAEGAEGQPASDSGGSSKSPKEVGGLKGSSSGGDRE